MTAGAATSGDTRDAPRDAVRARRGWPRPLLALCAALTAGAAASWPGALAPAAAFVGALLPVQQTMLLVVPAVAACALAGWLAGGRLWPALAWVVLAAWVVTRPLPNAVGGYAALARGWALLVAGLFGALCFFGGRQLTLVARALAATGLAVAFVTVLGMGGSGERVGQVMHAEAQRRVDAALAGWTRETSSPWGALARRVPDAVAAATVRAEAAEDALRHLPNLTAVLLPALTALETFAALALAWVLYHRASRTRLGPDLGPLRAFHFNDQLVWGLVVGATLVAVPSLAALRPAGINLLVFFGALYALRGFGVLGWALGRWGVEVPLGAGVLVGLVSPLLGGVLAALVAAAAVALGLGDSWGGWRARRPNAAHS